jgi:D-alanyl-D-alanine carboxypeptidase (penicillin-binding protein 5/6)
MNRNTRSVCVCAYFISMLQGSLAATFPEVTAEGAIVITAENGAILGGKNENRRMPMASTTKIMTALIAIERTQLPQGDPLRKTLNDQVTIGYYPTHTDFTNDVTGLSVLSIGKGERWTLRDLLYAMMLKSDNTAGQTVAEYLVGCESRTKAEGLECNARFAALMNERAQRPDLRLRDTSFQNPVGLNKDGHYSTPRDLAILGMVALRNPVLAEIVKSRNWAFNRDPGTLVTNDVTSFFLDAYPGANGVKSGTTAGAGRCYVGSATLFGKTVITVVLNSDEGHRFDDTMKLLDFGFDRLLTVRFTGNGFTTATSGTDVEIVSYGPNRALTAERGADGNLSLSAWNVSSAGYFQRLSSSTDSSTRVNEIALAVLSNSRIVSAVQDPSGNLKLGTWDVDGQGVLTLRTSTVGPSGRNIRIRALTSTKIVTAMISAGGLRLNTWTLEPNNLWTRQSEVVVNEVIDRLALTSYCLECDPDGSAWRFGVVTATRSILEQYSLKVIAWSVSTSGTITRTGHATNQEGAVYPGWGGEIDVISDTYTNKIVTAGQNTQGDLQLHTWEIDRNVVRHLESSASLAGSASQIRLTDTSAPAALTAVRIPGSGRLKLIAWGLARDGSLRRLTDTGSEGEEPVSRVTICRVPGVAGGGYVAAVRNGQDRLQLIHIAVP